MPRAWRGEGGLATPASHGPVVIVIVVGIVLVVGVVVVVDYDDEHDHDDDFDQDYDRDHDDGRPRSQRSSARRMGVTTLETTQRVDILTTDDRLTAWSRWPEGLS